MTNTPIIGDVTILVFPINSIFLQGIINSRITMLIQFQFFRQEITSYFSVSHYYDFCSSNLGLYRVFVLA